MYLKTYQVFVMCNYHEDMLANITYFPFRTMQIFTNSYCLNWKRFSNSASLGAIYTIVKGFPSNLANNNWN